MNRTGSNDDTLLTITSAKDIQYAFLLSMNTGGYNRGREFESWLQKKGLGKSSNVNIGHYFISSGQEYRTRKLGHVTIVLGDEYLKGAGRVEDVDQGPALAVIADQAHDLNGYIGLNHGGYHHQEADALLLERKMDFLELLQFGGYRSLGLDGWYDFLNIGFRIPIVGACDFPYTRELGSEITYVWIEAAENDIPSPVDFMQGIAKGNSFATSGPMLFFSVMGKNAGDIIDLPAEVDTTVTVELKVSSHIYPVQNLELVVNGRVVEREYSAQSRNDWEVSYNLRIDKSCWIAARTYGGAGTEAHSNPVYIYCGAKKPFDRDSAALILARLDGSTARITNKEVVKRLSGLRKELVRLIEGRSHKLLLPDIIP
jgi:hypothetical protein